MDNVYNKYYEGIFWLPGNELTKVIATLYIDGKGQATISSLQGITGKFNTIERNWGKIDLVLGFLSSNESSKTFSVKLYDINKSHQSIGALNKYKYSSNKVFISKSYDADINEPFFNTLMLSSEALNSWIPFTGFNYEIGQSEDFEVSHKYKQPNIVELFRDDNYHIYIYARANAEFPAKRKSSISEEMFINIETAIDYPAKDLFKLKQTLDRLFSLLFDSTLSSSQIDLRSTSGKTYKFLGIDDHIVQTLGSSKVKYDYFVENSIKIFSNWFSKQDSLELFITNYYSVFGRKGVLIENRFLTYISALENYHRNNIIKNDEPLKNRLVYLIKNSTVEKQIDDIEEYAIKLKTTRNYHAHLEEKHKKNSLSMDGIIKANAFLEKLIREILLTEIGIKN